MQGNKVYQEKLFTDFQLSQFVPKENFYRRLTTVERILPYGWKLPRLK